MNASNHGLIFMIKLFNTSFESSLRVLLVLYSINPQAITVDRITAYDFMTLYGKDFEVTTFNLHGDNSFNFSELPSKRSSISTGIKEAALNGMVSVKQTKSGFCYAISELGIKYVESFSSNYACQYLDTIEKVHHLNKNKTDAALTTEINNKAIKNLRR